MDILERLDVVIKDFEVNRSFKYIPKENAIKILEYIEKSVSEDAVLLETVKQYIIKDWSFTNTRLIEQFYKLLMYYGIIEGNIQRKSILENKGKTIIKKFVTIESKNYIIRLLDQ